MRVRFPPGAFFSSEYLTIKWLWLGSEWYGKSKRDFRVMVMARLCNNLQELRSEIMKRVNKSLKDYVGEKVKEVMLEHI